MHKAYPASSTNAGSPARDLLPASKQHVTSPAHTKEIARSSKRKDCMDYFTSKKPRHSSGSSTMPSKVAFDAAEKLMQDNVIIKSEE